MTIGNRISALRREQKLSQEEIADTLNVSRQAVSKWENDLSSPDTENLIALSELLGVDVEYLATGNAKEEPSAPAAVPEKKTPKLLYVVLVFLLGASLVFFGLWQREREDMSEMEELIRTSAYACRQNLLSIGEYQEAYYQAIGDFRCFMQGWYQRWGDGAHDEYICFNVIYSYMISEPDALDTQKEELLQMLELYSKDIQDRNAYNLLYKIYINLLHG